MLGKAIPEKLSERLMQALGLCTLLIGLTGTVKVITFSNDQTVYSQNIILIIISMVVGTLIGELLDLDRLISKGATALENKINKNGGNAKIAEGFIAATLLFCVGAMTIVGSLNSGLTGDHQRR